MLQRPGVSVVGKKCNPSSNDHMRGSQHTPSGPSHLYGELSPTFRPSRKQLPSIRSVQRLGRPAQRSLSAPHRVSPHAGSRVFLKGFDDFAAMTRGETHADEHRFDGPNVTPITCFPKVQYWKCKVMEPGCATTSFKTQARLIRQPSNIAGGTAEGRRQTRSQHHNSSWHRSVSERKPSREDALHGVEKTQSSGAPGTQMTPHGARWCALRIGVRK